MRGTVAKRLKREARVIVESNPQARGKNWAETMARTYSRLKKEYKRLPQHIWRRDRELRLQSKKKAEAAKRS